MAPLDLGPRETHVPVPVAGKVIGVVIGLISTTVLSMFLTQRFQVIRVWRRLPFVVWIVFAIYVDSYLFVFVTAILQHAFGVNSSFGICDGAILLCLVCYVTTKLIYIFLVEKAHIVRCTPKKRLHSKLYIFNSFGMLTLFVVVGALNFYFRIVRMDQGECVIGMRSYSMIPLISFDSVVNVYLTSLFLIPLKNLYSLKTRSPTNYRLRNVALRTFIGALCTLTSSIVNLSVLLGLNGEPGWVCLICCNCDILFSAIVIHWVTSKDNVASSTLTTPVGPDDQELARRAQHRASMHGLGYGGPDITLETVRRSFQMDNEGDDNTSATTMASAKETTITAPAVVVTTTIHRESTHNSRGSSSNDNQRISDPPRLHDFAQSSPENVTAPTTIITVGDRNMDEKPGANV